VLSAGIFINQVSSLEVDIHPIDAERMRKRGMDIRTDCRNIRVAYLTGPLFFAATNTFNEAFAHEEDVDYLVLSMRGVPLIDLSGIEALHTLHDNLHQQGKTLLLAGVHPKVLHMMRRAGVDEIIGKENFFWSADRAILVAEQRTLHLAGAEAPLPELPEETPGLIAMPI
jgi:SulP family sulfate permease